MTTRQFLAEYPDLLYSILFAIYLVYLKDHIKTEALKVDYTTITTKDFAVKIDDLPPETTEQDIRNHFKFPYWQSKKT